MDHFDDYDIRRILLEHQLIHTGRELCVKWGIKAHTLATWKKKFAPWRRDYGLREFVIVALHRGGGKPSDMIPLLDYLDTWTVQSTPRTSCLACYGGSKPKALQSVTAIRGGTTRRVSNPSDRSSFNRLDADAQAML